MKQLAQSVRIQLGHADRLVLPEQRALVGVEPEAFHAVENENVITVTELPGDRVAAIAVHVVGQQVVVEAEASERKYSVSLR